KLAQSGFDVTFLARGEHLKELQSNGLIVRSIDGDFHVKELTATSNISDIGKSDLILLAVKSWQVSELREGLKNLIHSNSLIVPLQNGVSVYDELNEVIDSSHILGGVCKVVSKIEAPGIINHFGAKPLIIFGKYSNETSDYPFNPKVVFTQAGIDSIQSQNIELEIWKKFAFICVGGLMAVFRVVLGDLRSSEETRSLTLELLREIVSVGEKLGVVFEEGFVNTTMEFIDDLPYETTFSIARDIWENRPSELDSLNGAVVNLGKLHEVSTPLNDFIYNSLLPLELKLGNT
ncbi:MAG: 2-dehydropantoate 2-reductase, partial [Cyclobacteriaceae bacterium]